MGEDILIQTVTGRLLAQANSTATSFWQYHRAMFLTSQNSPSEVCMLHWFSRTISYHLRKQYFSSHSSITSPAPKTTNRLPVSLNVPAPVIPWNRIMQCPVLDDMHILLSEMSSSFIHVVSSFGGWIIHHCMEGPLSGWWTFRFLWPSAIIQTAMGLLINSHEFFLYLA